MATPVKTVELGEHRLPVVAQRHARLRHHLAGADLEKVLGREYGRETYRLLGVLIPAIPENIPEWEWEGYGSQDAMVNGEYVEGLDKSPLTAQIAEAFEEALKINGADRVGKLLGLVQTVQKMSDQAQNVNAGPTPDSPDSPGENGE